MGPQAELEELKVKHKAAESTPVLETLELKVKSKLAGHQASEDRWVGCITSTWIR